MPDVTLVLKADNSNLVKGLKESQQATQKLYDFTTQGAGKAIGVIEKEETVLRTLQDLKKQASLDDIKYYNQAIDQSRKRLQSYEDEGKVVEKKTDGIVNSIGRMAVAYLSVDAAIKVLQGTLLAFFTKSEQGFEMLERKVSGFKAAVGVLQGEFIKFGKTLFGNKDEVIKWGSIFEKTLKGIAFAFGLIPAAVVSLLPASNKILGEFSKQMNEASAAAENLTRMQQELEDAERSMIVTRAKANQEIAKARLLAADDTKSIEERIIALQKAIDLENKTAEEELKHQQMVILTLRDYNAELEKRGQLRDEDSLLLEQAIAKEIDLQTDSFQRQLRATNSLMSLKKEAYQKNIDEIKAAQDQFNEYWDKVDAKERQRIEDKWQWQVDLAFSKYDELQRIAKEAWDKIIADEKIAAKAQEQIAQDTAEAKKAILQESTNIILMTTDLLSVINQNQQQKEIGMLDRKTKMLLEIAAINGLTKEEEVRIFEQAEAEKLEIEKKYRNRQKAIAIAQATIDTTLAVIRAYKDYMWPFNLIVAGIMAAQGAIKIAIIKSQKFAKGGWTGDGGDRDETGERVAGVVHEKEFVTKRGPASKYREVLEAINRDDKKAIYNSFTKIEPELLGNTTNVTVENSGPNNRLDRINNQLSQLNRNLSPKRQVREDVMTDGNTTIIRRGANVRTIRR